MEDGIFVEAYLAFRKARPQAPFIEPAPYNWAPIPESVPIRWGPYHLMLREYALALSNEINMLGYNVRGLLAWIEVLKNYSPQEQFELVYEFVEPLAFKTLNSPSAISSRFAYTATHLCHQANQIMPGWEDRIENERDITYKSMKLHSKPWKARQGLLKALKRVDDSAFKRATKDFRNSFHHRIPPKLEVGMTQFVSRIEQPNGRVAYGFGFVPPLKLTELTASIREQHAACLAAFKCFQELVEEHLERMYATPIP